MKMQFGRKNVSLKKSHVKHLISYFREIVTKNSYTLGSFRFDVCRYIEDLRSFIIQLLKGKLYEHPNNYQR